MTQELLAIAGNGRVLMRYDVEAVVEALETDATQAFPDAVRLLRYMADELAAWNTCDNQAAIRLLGDVGEREGG